MSDYQKYLEILNDTEDSETFYEKLEEIKRKIETDYQHHIQQGNSKAISFLKSEQNSLHNDYNTFRKREEHFEEYLNARFDLLEKYLANL